ncbi:MAG TPA: Dabb family protein [Streptosporangiaceae bacterium]|nr:Dabb family protein [Streptosporangiaceae bacterium]
MIRHVVVFSWIPEATQEQKAYVVGELGTLPPLIEGLRSYQFGPDLGLVEGNADFAVVADFDDVAAYLAYRDHPAHQDVIKRAIRPILAQRMGIQLEI